MSGRTRRRRGFALVLVLLGLAFLTFLGFALGDLCVINLNMSRQYLSTSRARLLAQAAVQQFMVSFDQACRRARSNNLDLEKKQGLDLDLRGLYASGEGLPNRTADMAGKVTITFDSSQPCFSTDNSMNEYSKAGWNDRGTAEKSVPPFSVELIVSVELDGAPRQYQAIITRRWPFAVFAERGLIVMSGTPSGTTVGDDHMVSPSSVEGRVGTLEKSPPLGSVPLTPQAGAIVVNPAGVSQGYMDATTAMGTVASQAHSPVASLSKRMAEMLQIEQDKYTAYADAAVTIGPDITMTVSVTEPSSAPSGAGSPAASGSPPALDVTTVSNPHGQPSPSPLPGGVTAVPSPPSTVEDHVTDQGNSLVGDVYVPATFRPAHFDGPSTELMNLNLDIKPVDARPGNTYSGTVHYDEFPDGVDREHNPVEDAAFPSTWQSDYKTVPRPDPPAEIKAELQMYDGGPPTANAQMPASQASNPDNDTSSFGFLFGTLVLDPEGGDNPPFQFGGSNRFIFKGDLGNRFIKAISKPPQTFTPGGAAPTPSPSPGADTEPVAFHVFESSGGIKLNNCVLYVSGNLDLSARQRPGNEVGIEGNNSTLIVNGTLALNGGHLDSRDQGMVIMANDVILRASGEYRGLIIAKNSLAILPATADGRADSTLTIRGGVMCGNNGAHTVLRSVHLIYDPVYMKAVHNYGKAACTLWRDLK